MYKEVQCHHQDKAVDFCKRLRHTGHNPHENIYDQIKYRKHFKICFQINKSTYLLKYKSTNTNKQGITHFVRTWRVHVYHGARNDSFSEILRTYFMLLDKKYWQQQIRKESTTTLWRVKRKIHENLHCKWKSLLLALLRRSPLSYRNQSIDLPSKSIERVK